MVLSNPHIIFKSIEGKIKAGVVELPNKEDYSVMTNGKGEYIGQREYEKVKQQALANPILFKEDKDEEKVSRLIKTAQGYSFDKWNPELDKPYKIEGVEIEIKEVCQNDCDLTKHGDGYLKNCLSGYSKKYCDNIKQFAVIKQPKDVFDTGARLPEQKEQPGFPIDGYRSHPKEKEESQDELWEEMFRELLIPRGLKVVAKIKSKFTIKRR